MSSTLTRSSLALSALVLFGPPAQAQVSQPYNEHVLEMTPAIVQRLERALNAEEAEQKEVARVAASVRTPEAYQTCMMEAVGTSEGQALMEAMNAKSEAYVSNTSDPAAGAAYRKAQQDVLDYMAKTCGPDPRQFEATELPKLRARPAKAGQEAGGFTVTQYAILKERIAPLCGIAEAAGPDGVRIPGEGNNIFWVYSPTEVQTLLPRCAELSRLVAATL